MGAGQYRVDRELGRGGMAAVFLGHDLSLDRQVAITVFAVREAQDVIFFVMKFDDGKALDAVVKKAGPLPIPVVACMMSQAADALADAHRSGIIHRDIKPSNLMLDKEGWIVVTDLGIAKVRDSQALTATGSAMGTPTSMSPEQSLGSRTTTAAAVPRRVGSVAHLPASRRSAAADPSLRPDVPAELASTVMRMFEKAPEDRFSNLDDAGAAHGDLFAVLPRLRQRMNVVERAGSLYQQLAQQLWLPADASMLLKVRELFAAHRLARAITPDRALELYLNTAESAATLTTPRSSTPTDRPAEMKARAALLLRAMSGDSVAIPRPYERVAPEAP